MKTPHQHILKFVVARILPYVDSRGTRNRMTDVHLLNDLLGNATSPLGHNHSFSRFGSSLILAFS